MLIENISEVREAQRLLFEVTKLSRMRGDETLPNENVIELAQACKFLLERYLCEVSIQKS